MESDGFAAPLKHYLAIVGAVGLTAPALAGLASGGASWTAGEALRVVLLAAFAAAACRYPLKLSHHYTYSVPDIAYVAAILLFPPVVAGALAVVAGLGFLADRHDLWVVRCFNLGQNAAYVTAGAVVFAALHGQGGLGPTIGKLGTAGAISGAALTMLLVNTALVAGAIAIQAESSYWRVWRGKLRGDAPVFAVLAAVGVVAALLVRDYPLALPVLVLPAALLQLAQRRGAALRTDTHEALASLVEIVELRDPYTAGHSHRVATLARELAERLGLTPEEADAIETAGRIHDLGKVALDPAVLLKFGPLDEREWVQMRQHPVHGADVVARFADLDHIEALVRHHHERWDGAGYPDGLKGEAIPFGARILAVADAFDAMTSARSYRPARGPDAALRVLEDGAGAQWDRRVVQALVALQRGPVAAAEALPAATSTAVPV